MDNDPAAVTSHSLSLILQAAINNEEGKVDLMSMKDAEAIKMMTYMQEVIDHSTQANSDQRHVVRRLLVKLSRESAVLPPNLFLSDIIRHGESIAGGSFADIFRAEYHGQDVALKRLRVFLTDTTQRVAQFDIFCREALLWRQLNHPNILAFLGVDAKTFESSDLYCMVSSWMENGSMIQCIDRLCEEYGRSLMDKWACETIQGLKFLHDECVIHGDLRGANILVNGSMSVQLSDFGLSKFVDASTASWGTNSRGSVRWTAPEVFQFGRATFKSDVYSFGCVCIEIYERKQPFSQLVNDPQVITHVLGGVHPAMQSSDTRLAETILTLIESCWDHDPSARPSASSLAENFTSGYVKSVDALRPNLQSVPPDKPTSPLSPFADATHSVTEIANARGVIYTSANLYGEAGDLLPQLTYRPPTENGRICYVIRANLKQPIIFMTQNPDGCGIPCRDVCDSKFARLVGSDDLMFSDWGPSVAIRLLWPGYHSWCSQIHIRDFRSPPGPITRAKLSNHVANAVARFLADFKDRPMHDDADLRWKVGPSHITLDDLDLVGLQHVSMGSWQVHLRVRRQTAHL